MTFAVESDLNQFLPSFDPLNLITVLLFLGGARMARVLVPALCAVVLTICQAIPVKKDKTNNVELRMPQVQPQKVCRLLVSLFYQNFSFSIRKLFVLFFGNCSKNCKAKT